jgi:hypothetical protein
MATATATIPRTTQRPPSPRERRHARELARLQRAATLYQRGTGWAVNDSPDAYRWYADFLRDNYPAPGWGC